jgi:signal transduction histidine kinase
MVEQEDSLVRGLLGGVATFRWLAWGWMVVVLVIGRPEFEHRDTRPWVAYCLAGLALVVTAIATVLLRHDWRLLTTTAVIVTEIMVGFSLGVGDELAYNGVPHPQWLASSWPLAGIFTTGIVLGGRGGLLAGITVGLGRLVGDQLDPDFNVVGDSDDLISAVSTVVLYALAGAMAGYVTVKLRDAERRVSLAQAREEVARTLHDGVMQTLAIVQRRASDPDVVRLAHEQERELREFLFGSATAVSGGGEVGTRLRQAAARFEDRHGATARVVLAPDMPTLPAPVADALVGAVTEALTNAGKHGEAQMVTVYAEPVDGSVFCSVKDDGAGFDPATVPEGVGLERSIRGRVIEVGGQVEVDARPGRGTEVRCWLPI